MTIGEEASETAKFVKMLLRLLECQEFYCGQKEKEGVAGPIQV